MTVKVKKFAISEFEGLIPCPTCGTYTEYDGPGEYECPDCGEEGFNIQLTGRYAVVVRK